MSNYPKNITGVYQALKDFLPTVCHVDEFSLNYPSTFTSETAIKRQTSHWTILPVESLSCESLGLNEVRARGLFQLQGRYTYSMGHSLDIISVEKFAQLASVIQVRAMRELRGVSPIVDVEPDEVEFPVALSKGTDPQGDWLVGVAVGLIISFNITDLTLHPDFAPGGEPPIDVPLNQIRIRTYESPMPLVPESPPSNLDMDFLLDLETQNE